MQERSSCRVSPRAVAQVGLYTRAQISSAVNPSSTLLARRLPQRDDESQLVSNLVSITPTVNGYVLKHDQGPRIDDYIATLDLEADSPPSH